MSQPETDDADAKPPGTTASEPPKAAEAEAEAASTKTASAPPGPPSEATAAEPTDAAPSPASGELALNGADAATSGPGLQTQLDTARADSLKFRDQLLRTAADFDNFRKRTRRELEDAQKKGTEKALKEMLPVFDNLERALVSAETAPDAKSVADGLRLVGRQFNTTLDKMGIKRVQTVGLPFDPMRHEAISHVASDEHPAGVIAAEVQAGYILGDFLLRAALVAVSAGPGPAGDASDAEDPAAPKEPAASG